jgi:16S rRNA (cytidine1402-2'-O)-methyltransferase
LGTLYVVSTPIGNLEDISLRALRVLREARLIAAEDTREARKLLTHYDIHTPLISYHAHNERARVASLLAALAEGDVALVSDAGTPTVSDPGQELIQAAIAAGYPLTAVPGPAAAVTALTLSGLDTARFFYLGFLPRTSKERRRLLEQVAEQPWPLVCYEAPHRVRATLADLLAVLGDRPCAVARELTKLHEEVRREPLSAALAHFTATAPRGEFTLVVEGAPAPSATETAVLAADQETQARTRLAALVAGGARSREAVAEVAAALALPRRQVYKLWLEQAALGNQTSEIRN